MSNGEVKLSFSSPVLDTASVWETFGDFHTLHMTTVEVSEHEHLLIFILRLEILEKSAIIV